MDTSLDTLKQLLKREIGLDASTVGDATIRKFLGQRMRARSLENITDYYSLLASDRTEVGALLETAVIPETWFFRDIRPFNFILDAIKNNPVKYLGNSCNILCIPCSTGEEPYSIAMYFLQADIPTSCFNIKAVDISQRALDIAAQGCYGNNSFRGRTDQKYLDRYFSFSNGQHLINDNVRQCIAFRRVNILDASTLPYDQHFDFVLCRNLLIYFDSDTKLKAFRNLHRILKDDGVLFIGHSEFGAMPKELFFNTGADNAFGLIKYVPKEITEKVTLPLNQYFNPLETLPSAKAKKSAPEKPAFANFIPSPVAVATDTTPQSDTFKGGEQTLLERAQQLADAGKLNDAEKHCLHHIEENGDNCDSFFLLALINESAGNQKMAETFFRKAIYLNPKHYQSLIHLSLLMEKIGDHKSALLFRQRAERISKN